jgi:hypothetical protein
VLFAGFSTNWPAYEYQREGYSQATQVYAAANERLYAFGFSTIGGVSRWRSQRAELIAVKEAIAAMYDTDLIVPAYATADSMTNTVTNNVRYYKGRIEVLHDCGLPTNYFDYTPWRCLNGLGPFTNDTSVGRGHGWTNQYTVLGGTNFPETTSRAAWYTTDYGWDGIKYVINTTRQWRADIEAGLVRYATANISRKKALGVFIIPPKDVSNYLYDTNYLWPNGSLFDDAGVRLSVTSAYRWSVEAAYTNGASEGVIGDHYAAKIEARWFTNFFTDGNMKSVTGLTWVIARERRQDRQVFFSGMPTQDVVDVYQWVLFAKGNDQYTCRDYYGIAGGSATTPGITNRILPFGSVIGSTPTNVIYMPIIGSNTYTEPMVDAGIVDFRSSAYGYGDDPINVFRMNAGIVDSHMIYLFKWHFDY